MDGFEICCISVTGKTWLWCDEEREEIKGLLDLNRLFSGDSVYGCGED